MLNHYCEIRNPERCELPADIQNMVSNLISGIMALAARATNSNSDSNSLGGTNYWGYLEDF